MRKKKIRLLIALLVAVMFIGCIDKSSNSELKTLPHKDRNFRRLKDISSKDLEEGRNNGDYYIFDEKGMSPDSGFVRKASTAVDISKAIIKEHYDIDVSEDIFQIFMCDGKKWIIYGPLNVGENEIRNTYYVEIGVKDGSILKLVGFK